MEFKISRDLNKEINSNFLTVSIYPRINEICFYQGLKRSDSKNDRYTIGFWHIKPKNKEHKFLLENFGNE